MSEEEQGLLEYFMTQYLTRRGVMHRLPASLTIGTFWPELFALRRERAIYTTLPDAQGAPLWFVETPPVAAHIDAIAEFARSEPPDSFRESDTSEEREAEAMLDEALYSSAIEGASSSRRRATTLIRKGASPADESERMILNNYRALEHALEHTDEPIDEGTILKIFAIVTEGTAAAPKGAPGWRDAGVQVVSASQRAVYTAPSREKVPGMMRALVEFIRDEDAHPLVAASIAHFYFVHVHPFFDGNGRTARALSLMILLQAGYDVFRGFSLSNLIASERAKYYRAIRDVEESDGDMTYFVEYCTGVMARGVKKLGREVAAGRALEALRRANLPERAMKGAKWLLSGKSETITIGAWSKKYAVSFETARQDLFKLEELGILKRRIEGRRFVFEICHYLRCPNTLL